MPTVVCLRISVRGESLEYLSTDYWLLRIPLPCFSSPWLLPAPVPSPTKRCVQIHSCPPVQGLHAHLGCFLVYKESTPWLAFSYLCRASPLFHIWLWKTPQPLTPATKHRAPFELYSVCVIRQETWNKPTRVNLLWHFAKVTHPTEDLLVCFLWTMRSPLCKMFLFLRSTFKAEMPTILPHSWSEIQVCCIHFSVLFTESVLLDLICIKAVFYMAIHLVNWLSKSKDMVRHLSWGRLCHLNV